MLLEKTIINKNLTNNKIQSIKNFKTIKKYCNNLLIKKNLTNNKIQKEEHHKKVIKYTITIRYYRTNISLTASETNGKTFFICVSKPNNLKKKLKTNRKLNLKKLIKNLMQNYPSMINNPIALHLINVGYEKKLILKEFSGFFILILKIFNINPHNGCRPPKKQRIKRRFKKFFTFSKTKKNKLFLKTIKENNI